MGELKALKQLTLFVQHQRLERQGSVSIKVQFKTVAMLIPRNYRQRNRRAAGDTGVTNLTKLVPLGKRLRVETLAVPDLSLANLRGQVVSGTFHMPIDQQDLCGRTIKLKQTFLHTTVTNLLPHSMAGEATVSFVYEGTCVTLLMLRCRKAFHPSSSISSKGRH